MKLSKKGILDAISKGNIVISPFNENNLNPNSYNVTLHNTLLVYEDPVLDMKKVNSTRTIVIPDEGYLLLPGELYLGRTVEWTETIGYVPCLSGRSSTGRLGLDIHICAGFGDNGFAGYWTLEIRVVKPLIIYPYAQVGQLYFDTISEYNEEDLYSGKYNNNKGIQSSKLYEDFI